MATVSSTEILVGVSGTLPLEEPGGDWVFTGAVGGGGGKQEGGGLAPAS